MQGKDIISKIADGINRKKMIVVKFMAKGSGHVIERKCAPLDYALSKRAKVQRFKIHFWDFESAKQNHVLSLDAEQIIDLKVADENFEPKDFINWDTKASPWLIMRDWGIYS